MAISGTILKPCDLMPSTSSNMVSTKSMPSSMMKNSWRLRLQVFILDGCLVENSGHKGPGEGTLLPFALAHSLTLRLRAEHVEHEHVEDMRSQDIGSSR